MDKVSLRTFLTQTTEQQQVAWYDWFCRDSSLPHKTKILAQRVRGFVKAAGDKLDQDKHYVWFKNNCPLYGSLYDDFRIADIETNNTVYCVVPASGFDSKFGQAELWMVKEDGDFCNVLGDGKSYRDLKAYIKAL